jgi:hypothetical protein
MDMFSTVTTDLACERCGSTYRTGVEFKTGEDWALPVYEAGQVVPALPSGSDYEGIADAFCPDCARRWIADERVAHFDALADDVEIGKVTARLATYQADLDQLDLGRQLRLLRGEPLTAAEVRSLASTPDDFGWPSFPARLSRASVTLFLGGMPWTTHLAIGGPNTPHACGAACRHRARAGQQTVSFGSSWCGFIPTEKSASHLRLAREDTEDATVLHLASPTRTSQGGASERPQGKFSGPLAVYPRSNLAGPTEHPSTAGTHMTAQHASTVLRTRLNSA